MTPEHAQQAAEILGRVADGRDEVIGDHTYARDLARRKLGELLDDVGGLESVPFADDPELARMMRADAEGETLAWLDPR